MLIDLEHLRENAYKIYFLVEITDDVVAKCPLAPGKRFAVLQKAQNGAGLTLGQHPNRGKRLKSHAGAGDELIGG
ncbi:MAG TPA: hypothetical protein VMU78_05285 [Methylocella sp.]|nr:hypothetical protein [Methylocella sp.]